MTQLSISTRQMSRLIRRRAALGWGERSWGVSAPPELSAGGVVSVKNKPSVGSVTQPVPGLGTAVVPNPKCLAGWPAEIFTPRIAQAAVVFDEGRFGLAGNQAVAGARSPSGAVAGEGEAEHQVRLVGPSKR